MKAEPIVFVVDEDARSTDAIRRLAAMMDLECRVYASGLDFLEAFDRSQSGCLVTELKVPGINGLQLQQRLAAEGVALPVIFLTSAATLPIAVRAMRAGAFHFLEKPFHEQELWDAIQDAIALDRQRRQAMDYEEEVRRRLMSLTIKEEQVLRMIAQGKTNRAIAKELDLSIRTIEVRRNSLMRKLGIEAPDELIRFAVSACNGHFRSLGAGTAPQHAGSAARPLGQLAYASPR
ncbi:MAG: response regulator [Thermoguttaceae bacterium]|jgi:FixJ family two-component response regulator|nr:response regulator [Thermoguttaceae bacterium]